MNLTQQCFKQLVLLAVLTAAMGTTHPAFAAIVTLDDFETASSTPGNPPWNFKSSPSNTSFNIVTDPGDIFLQGSSNRYTHLIDANGSGGLNLGDTNGDGPMALYGAGTFNNTVTTLAFQFYDPNPGQSTLVVRIGNNNTGGGTSVDARFGDQGVSNGGGGAVFEGGDFFDENELVEVNIVFNDTTSSFDDYEGTQDVGSGKFDIWVVKPSGNKFLAVDEGVYRNGWNATNNQNLDSIVFQTFSSSTGEWYIDNLTLADGGQVGIIPVIPEPASLILFGIGAICCLYGRKSV